MLVLGDPKHIYLQSTHNGDYHRLCCFFLISQNFTTPWGSKDFCHRPPNPYMVLFYTWGWITDVFRTKNSYSPRGGGGRRQNSYGRTPSNPYFANLHFINVYITKTTGSLSLKRVQKLQNFAAKVAIVGASKYDHTIPLLNKLRWLPIRQKVIYEQCLTSFKIMNNQLPSWLFCFPQVRNVNSTNTRQQDLLHIPRTKTDTGSRSITVSGPKIWSNLPSNVKECNNLHALKAE